MIGQSLLHYQIAEKIGEGGMGAVYRAVDTHLDRPVAIKILPADKVADAERKQRFIQEAKAASALRHPNIVVIHDIASDRGGDFIVMELVEGQSLDVLIGRRGLKLTEALGLAVQIADGLAKAHAAGIVHRDLKPTNVMVTGDGLVKILDFGLAKLMEDVPDSGSGPTMTMDRDAKPRTEEGYILGTAAYMSPEQAEGKRVDARSDIFSFGTVLYEMLTGRKAFDRDSRIKTLAAVLNEEPKSAIEVNDRVPPEVEHILNRCLRKDPQRRWQTMSDLKVALQDLKEDSESGKLQAAAAPRGRRKIRLPLLAAGAVLVLAAAAVVFKLAVPRPGAGVEYEIAPLTYDTGATLWSTVSADGNLLAYSSDREGTRNFDIWIQQVPGGRPLRRTEHPADDWYPALSPDGSKIAFRSERDGGGIYLMDTIAGEARLISDKGLAPKFSPDGRFIAAVDFPPSLDSRLNRIYLVPVDGSAPRPLLQDFVFLYGTQGSAPVWSPDGKSILFRGYRIGDPTSDDWWVAPVDGRDPVRTHASENIGMETIVVFPAFWTGDDVYFVAGTTIEGINIFKARISPGDWTIKGPAKPVTTGPGMKLGIAVTRDGRIFFTDMTAIITAWTVAARADTAEVSAPAQRLAQDLMQKFSPTISRDGDKAAFVAFGGVHTGKFEIRIMDLSNGQERQFPVRGLNVNKRTRLSADGSLLAYRDVVEGRSRTFILAPEASAEREICVGCIFYDFFPGNGSGLVQTKPGELMKMDLETGEKTTILISGQDSIDDAKLSPDGEWVAWLAGEPDGRVAVRIGPAGSPDAGNRETITVAEAAYHLRSPAWSPNGRWLYYLSEKSGSCVIIAQELDPRTKEPVGKEREVFSSPESRFRLNFPQGIGTIAVAADRIIFTVTEGKGNVYVAKPKSR